MKAPLKLCREQLTGSLSLLQSNPQQAQQESPPSEDGRLWLRLTLTLETPSLSSRLSAQQTCGVGCSPPPGPDCTAEHRLLAAALEHLERWCYPSNAPPPNWPCGQTRFNMC